MLRILMTYLAEGSGSLTPINSFRRSSSSTISLGGWKILTVRLIFNHIPLEFSSKSTGMLCLKAFVLVLPFSCRVAGGRILDSWGRVRQHEWEDTLEKEHCLGHRRMLTLTFIRPEAHLLNHVNTCEDNEKECEKRRGDEITSYDSEDLGHYQWFIDTFPIQLPVSRRCRGANQLPLFLLRFP